MWTIRLLLLLIFNAHSVSQFLPFSLNSDTEALHCQDYTHFDIDNSSLISIYGLKIENSPIQFNVYIPQADKLGGRKDVISFLRQNESCSLYLKYCQRIDLQLTRFFIAYPPHSFP